MADMDTDTPMDARHTLAKLGDVEVPEGRFTSESTYVDVGGLLSCDYELQPDESLESATQRITQELVNAIFGLPIEKSTTGPLAVLPRPAYLVPREKPMPAEKPMTRWEKFAKEKGIVKHKRSKKVFDEATQTYKLRYGRGGANQKEDWLIEESNKVKDQWQGEYDDPFHKQMGEKKKRISGQLDREKRNIRDAEKQTAKELMGSSNAATQSVAAKTSFQSPSLQRLKRQIQMTQKSTRSLGVFDDKRKDEPTIKQRRPAKNLGNVANKDFSAEKATSLKTMESVMRKKDREQGSINTEKMANQHIRQEQLKKHKSKSSGQQNPKKRKRTD